MERSIAPSCVTGGARRTWLRGLENVRCQLRPGLELPSLYPLGIMALDESTVTGRAAVLRRVNACWCD